MPKKRSNSGRRKVPRVRSDTQARPLGEWRVERYGRRYVVWEKIAEFDNMALLEKFLAERRAIFLKENNKQYDMKLRAPDPVDPQIDLEELIQNAK